MIKPKLSASVPAYETLKGNIIEAIQLGELKPGDRIKSIKDLSSEYRMAKDSVQKAVQDLVIEKVLETRGVSGTYVIGFPEETQLRLENKTVLMLFGVDPEKKYASGQFRLGALEEFSKYGIKHKAIDASFFKTEDRETRLILKDILQKEKIDSIMIKWHRPFYLREMSHYPIVICNHYPPPSYYTNYIQLIHSEMERIYLTTEYLLEKGHQAIGLIAHQHKQSLESPEEAFEAVYEDYQLPFKPQWMLTDLETGNMAEVHKKITEFLKNNRDLSAICFADDVLCTVGLDVMASLGISIPDDMSVISFSNKGNGPFWKKEITRIEIDNFMFGQKCAQSLIKLLKKEIASGHIQTVAPQLIDGETVKDI